MNPGVSGPQSAIPHESFYAICRAHACLHQLFIKSKRNCKNLISEKSVKNPFSNISLQCAVLGFSLSMIWNAIVHSIKFDIFISMQLHAVRFDQH